MRFSKIYPLQVMENPAPAPGTSGDIMQKGTADEAHFQVESKTELVNRARVEFNKVREIKRFLNDLIRSPALQINDENDFRGRPRMRSANADIIDTARFLVQRLSSSTYDALLFNMESNLQRAVDATNPTRAKMTGIIGTQYGLPGATTSTVTSFGQPKTFNAPGGPTALIADFAGLKRGTIGRGRRRRTRRRSAH